MKIFFVLTCKKNRDRLEAIKKAWVPKEDSSSFKIFYVYGNPDNFKEEVEGRNLTIPCVDSYQKLFLKTHGSFRFLSRTFPEADCIVKMDDDIYVDSFDALLKNIDKLLDNNVNYFGNAFCVTHERSEEERNVGMREWHFQKVASDLHIPYRGKFPYSFACGETYGLDMKTSKFISSFSDQEILKDSGFTRPFEDVSVALLAERMNNLKKGVLDANVHHPATVEEILSSI